MVDIGERVTQLETMLENLPEALNIRFDHARAERDEIKAQISRLQVDVSEMKSEMKTMKADITAVKAEVQALPRVLADMLKS